ncbi:MAG: 50S ribosomal protein L30 [Candidatus Marinimicrobia bacterium]|nr:50S ribosomal protein L30 [Candidatus Neomarinimicrobiota bacterium]
MAAKAKTIKITQTKSGIGYAQRTKDTLRALGIRRMHQTVEKQDNPAIRGMINRVRHLVQVEEL